MPDEAVRRSSATIRKVVRELGELHLAELLRAVEYGETMAIARYGKMIADCRRESYRQAGPEEHALRQRGVTDVGIDGDWVTPYQVGSNSETGPVLVALHWLDAPSVEEHRDVLKEKGYLPSMPFNKVARAAPTRLACPIHARSTSKAARLRASLLNSAAIR